MSGEGRFLYAAVTLPSAGGGILRLDLDADPAVLATLPKQIADCCSRDITWTRTHGVPLVVSQGLEVYNGATGAAQTPVSVQPSLVQPGNLSFQFVGATRDGSEMWTFAQPMGGVLNDGCSSGVSYRMSIRSATGEGFLTPWRTQAPKIAGTSDCPSLRQFATTVNNDTWRAIGRISLGASAIYSGPAGQAMTQFGASGPYGNLAVSTSGLWMVSHGNPNAQFDDSVEVRDGTNASVHDFGGLSLIQDAEFSADDRFVIVLGFRQATNDDVHILRIP
jgi:hypothetical protein